MIAIRTNISRRVRAIKTFNRLLDSDVFQSAQLVNILKKFFISVN